MPDPGTFPRNTTCGFKHSQSTLCPAKELLVLKRVLFRQRVLNLHWSILKSPTALFCKIESQQSSPSCFQNQDPSGFSTQKITPAVRQASTTFKVNANCLWPSSILLFCSAVRPGFPPGNSLDLHGGVMAVENEAQTGLAAMARNAPVRRSFRSLFCNQGSRRSSSSPSLRSKLRLHVWCFRTKAFEKPLAPANKSKRPGPDFNASSRFENFLEN